VSRLLAFPGLEGHVDGDGGQGFYQLAIEDKPVVHGAKN
jgi:hypothetical protein